MSTGTRSTPLWTQRVVSPDWESIDDGSICIGREGERKSIQIFGDAELPEHEYWIYFHILQYEHASCDLS